MATECFCGCGRAVGLTRRSPNGMGRKVRRELEVWEDLKESLQEADEDPGDALYEFMDDGLWIYENLQALVHKEPIDKGFSNRKVTKWLLFSQRSMAKLDAEALRSAFEAGEDARP